MMDTDDLDRNGLYQLCCKLYRELRRKEPNVDAMAEWMEADYGFSLQDAEKAED